MLNLSQFNYVRADVRALRLDVLRAVARLKNDQGAVSYERIAEDLSCGRVTVYRHLKALEASGYIAKASRNTKPVQYKVTETGQQQLINYGNN